MGLIEDLKSLEEMHNSGKLSDAEFAAAKAAAIAGNNSNQVASTTTPAQPQPIIPAAKMVKAFRIAIATFVCFVAVVVLTVVYFLSVAPHESEEAQKLREAAEEKSEKLREAAKEANHDAAIKIITNYYVPSRELFALNPDFKSADWQAFDYPASCSYKDCYEVALWLDTMPNGEKKTIKAKWFVSLDTKQHQATNTEARMMFTELLIPLNSNDASGNEPSNTAPVPSATVNVTANKQSTSADTFDESSVYSGFNTYTNRKFGFHIDYPEQFTSRKDLPDGSGITVASANQEAVLSAFGIVKNPALTLKDYYDKDINDVHGTLGYKKIAGNWFVISWVTDGTISYTKTFVGNVGVNSFVFTFPESKKSQYAPVVDSIEKSFRAGAVNIN